MNRSTAGNATTAAGQPTTNNQQPTKLAMLKKIIYTAALLTTTLCTAAQVSVPAAYPAASTAPVSYIRTWDATAPVATEADLMSRPVRDVKQATQYLDGLGRPLQTVMKQGALATGSTAVDLVSSVIYDNLGREQYKYLPFAANSTGGNTSLADGLFKRNPFQEQAAFAAAQYPGEQYFYSKTNFEASPLNKVTDAYAPGNSWAGSEGQVNSHSTAADQFANTAGDNVWIWNAAPAAPGAFASFSTAVSYPAGELVKSITKDEQGRQVIEFKDRSGQVILKKVQLTATADDGTGSGNDGWLCTYYLYDDLGRLCCVVQPKAVEGLPGAGLSLTQNMLDEFCFRYCYDGRGRMIMKKVPGAGVVQMVYDALDRPVLTQDANMAAAGKWMYTKYDALSRAVETGLWATPLTRAALQAPAYGSTDYPVASGAAFEMLTQTRYGDKVPATPRNIYDDAEFVAASNSSYPYPQPLVQSYAVRNMVTQAWVKELDDPDGQGLNTISYYDDMGRPFASYAFNGPRDLDIITTQYSYSGQVLQSVHRIEKNLPLDQKYIVQTRMSYDDLGRPVQTEKKVTGITAAGTATRNWAVISANEYDALGQLKKKVLGGGLEAENYEYNIRGWLLGMNRPYTRDAAPPSGVGGPYFGFDLGYDKAANGLIGGSAYAAPQYNGNIAGTVWKSKGDGEKRRYDYSYDAANRLLKADFTQYTGGTFSQSAGVNFNVRMGDGATAASAYDANGNIKGMTQYGLKVSSSGLIDQLAYSYNSSNKLSGVGDAAPATGNGSLGDFKDGANSGDDYAYDANGNMVSDANKAISSIQYNHLNLPKLVTITGKGSIAYTYDAAGNKLKKVTTDNSTAGKQIVTTTRYLYGLVFENRHTTPADASSPDYDEVLQYAGHEEGRIRFSPVVGGPSSVVAFDYMLKDHLGNVRAVITDEQKVDNYPAATMETAQASTEELLYANVNTTRIARPGGYPADNTTSPNDNVAKVSGSGNKIGPSITLKVMAGDKFNIKVSSWYRANGTQPALPLPVTNLATTLINTITGTASLNPHAATVATLTGAGAFGSITDFLTLQSNNTVSSKPKAFLNWVLFDEQFNYVSSSSGAEQVGADQELKPHVKTDLPVNKNGYLYIYVSNETPNIDVFFDNLQVTHTRSPLLEETHYYPFGLVMSGISSKAAGGIINKEKTFQGQRFDDDFGLNWVQFKWRNHDPQIGRFIEIDPLSDKYVYNSTYAFSENKVTGHVELEGLEAVLTPDKSKNYSYNPFSTLMYLGKASVQAGNARVYYNKEVAKLNPSDKVGRAELKETVRKMVPEPFATITEHTRPIAGEKAKATDPNFIGNVNKSNIQVNEIAATTKTLGTVFLVTGLAQSSYTITTSPTPVRETITEGAGWAGAMYGGATGAAAWGSVAGPWGAAAGSIVGSTAGFFLGKNGSDAVISVQPAISAGAKDFYDYNERARQGVLDQNGWPLPIVCFTKETLIYGKNEFISIENIKIGDSVYSYNIEKDKRELSKVINTLKRETPSIYKITAGNEIINATSEHPIYVIGKGFTKVKDLQIGDVLKSFDNTIVRVSKITELNKAATVYNIEVDGNHDYFVTKSKILVHNKNISNLKK